MDICRSSAGTGPQPTPPLALRKGLAMYAGNVRRYRTEGFRDLSVGTVSFHELDLRYSAQTSGSKRYVGIVIWKDKDGEDYPSIASHTFHRRHQDSSISVSMYYYKVV